MLVVVIPVACSQFKAHGKVHVGCIVVVVTIVFKQAGQVIGTYNHRTQAAVQAHIQVSIIAGKGKWNADFSMFRFPAGNNTQERTFSHAQAVCAFQALGKVGAEVEIVGQAHIILQVQRYGCGRGEIIAFVIGQAVKKTVRYFIETVFAAEAVVVVNEVFVHHHCGRVVQIHNARIALIGQKTEIGKAGPESPTVLVVHFVIAGPPVAVGAAQRTGAILVGKAQIHSQTGSLHIVELQSERTAQRGAGGSI